MRFIKGALSRLGEAATRFESWWALAVLIMSSGVTSWVASQWQLLADQGWAAVLLVGIAATFMLACTMALLTWGWSRLFDSAAAIQPTGAGELARETVEQASNTPIRSDVHDRLSEFAALRLLPACEAQIALQDAILRQGGYPKFIEHLAKRGLWRGDELYQFSRRLEQLQRLSDSPPADISAEDLIEIIGRMENDAYWLFCFQRGSLADAAGIDYRTNPETATLWQSWASAHEAMVSAYETIKTNRALHTAQTHPHLPSLWRPARPSRWGDAS